VQAKHVDDTLWLTSHGQKMAFHLHVVDANLRGSQGVPKISSTLAIPRVLKMAFILTTCALTSQGPRVTGGVSNLFNTGGKF